MPQITRYHLQMVRNGVLSDFGVPSTIYTTILCNFETFADTTHVELPTALPLLLIFDLLVPYGVNALAS